MTFDKKTKVPTHRFQTKLWVDQRNQLMYQIPHEVLMQILNSRNIHDSSVFLIKTLDIGLSGQLAIY